MRFTRNYGFAILWALAAILMISNYIQDPFDPTLEGTDQYGHNSEGILKTGILFIMVELVVLYAIIRPWSKSTLWRRALFAFVLFLPWTFISMFMAMHAGGVVMVHLLWLSVVTLSLLFIALSGSISSNKDK